ncbi:MAG: hypothetical protein RR633_14210 [Acinetobacter sp.]
MSNLGNNAVDSAIAVERLLSNDPSYQTRHDIANSLVVTGAYLENTSRQNLGTATSSIGTKVNWGNTFADIAIKIDGNEPLSSKDYMAIGELLSSVGGVVVKNNGYFKLAEGGFALGQWAIGNPIENSNSTSSKPIDPAHQKWLNDQYDKRAAEVAAESARRQAQRENEALRGSPEGQAKAYEQLNPGTTVSPTGYDNRGRQIYRIDYDDGRATKYTDHLSPDTDTPTPR